MHNMGWSFDHNDTVCSISPLQWNECIWLLFALMRSSIQSPLVVSCWPHIERALEHFSVALSPLHGQHQQNPQAFYQQPVSPKQDEEARTPSNQYEQHLKLYIYSRIWQPSPKAAAHWVSLKHAVRSNFKKQGGSGIQKSYHRYIWKFRWLDRPGPLIIGSKVVWQNGQDLWNLPKSCLSFRQDWASEENLSFGYSGQELVTKINPFARYGQGLGGVAVGLPLVMLKLVLH